VRTAGHGLGLFRRPAAGTARSVDEISFTELRALASEMQAAGQDQDTGVLAMAREIGLRKLSATSRGRLERAWIQMAGPTGSVGDA
jgi:hypothetical protein